MKKRIITVLITLMSGVMFSGCQEAGNSENKVVIAGYGFDDETERYISLCRAKHPEISIEIKDYQQFGDPGDALKQLKVDLVAGKCGDILISTQYFHAEDYMDFGVFLDLNTIEESGDIKERILPNILTSVEYDDKITAFYPYFTINCYATKKNIVSDDKWNRDQLLEVFNATVENGQNFWGNRSDTKIQNFIISEICNDYSMDRPLDREWYTELIDTSRKMMKLSEDHKADESDDLIYKNEKVICREVSIDSFDRYYYLKTAVFDDDISLLGNASDENTICINPELMCSILSASQNQEDAWSVISYFMSEEFQRKIAYTESFPVSSEAFDLMYQNTLLDYYCDENGNYLEKKDGSYIINDNFVKFPLPKKEDLQEIYDQLTSINNISQQKYDLRNALMSDISTRFLSDDSSEQIFEKINQTYMLYTAEKE